MKFLDPDVLGGIYLIARLNDQAVLQYSVQFKVQTLQFESIGSRLRSKCHWFTGDVAPKLWNEALEARCMTLNYDSRTMKCDN